MNKGLSILDVMGLIPVEVDRYYQNFEYTIQRINFPNAGGGELARTTVRITPSVFIDPESPCCLKAKMEVEKPVILFFMRDIADHPVFDMNNTLGHEQLHISSMMARIKATAKEFELYRTCYDTEEQAKAAAIEVGEALSETVKEHIAAEEAHSQEGNYGTPEHMRPSAPLPGTRFPEIGDAPPIFIRRP